MKIRVPQLDRGAAAGAPATGLPTRSLAEKKLAQPQAEPLLPDPSRPRKEQDLGKPVTGNGRREPAPGLVMAGEGSQRHASKNRRRGSKREAGPL
jgi:hypothetical protein